MKQFKEKYNPIENLTTEYNTTGGIHWQIIQIEWKVQMCRIF